MTQELQATKLSTESAVSAPVTNTAAAATVGHALQGLRIARGWSLEDVSSRIKFSARQIEAVEAEQWDKLPKGVSLRGLIRSYARLLETDPTAIVLSVETQIGALTVSGTVHRKSRMVPVAVSDRSDDRGATPWGWLLLIIALLVGLFAYALWQHWIPAEWLPSWLSGANP